MNVFSSGIAMSGQNQLGVTVRMREKFDLGCETGSRKESDYE